MLQPQSATRVRHQGAGLRLAAPPGAAGTAAGRPGPRPRPAAPKWADACATSRPCGTIGADPDRKASDEKEPPGDRHQGHSEPGVRDILRPTSPRPVARRPAGCGRASRRQEDRRRHRATGDARRAEPHLPRPPARSDEMADVQPAAELVEADVQDFGPSVQQAQPVSCLARFIPWASATECSCPPPWTRTVSSTSPC